MKLNLDDKVAIVTGGSQGIGKATAKLLVAEGARVLFCARTPEGVDAAANDSGATGLVADVTNANDAERVVATAVTKFGRVDILVNNAGTARAGSFGDVTEEVWHADFELKLFAAMRFSRLCALHMTGGSIINVLSIGAKQPGPSSLPSSVTRAAGLALTKAMSKDLGPRGIRVNAVLIGFIKSAQHDARWKKAGGDRAAFYEADAKKRGVPLGRAGEADEAAQVIAFLASERASYVTGTGINVDGGACGVT